MRRRRMRAVVPRVEPEALEDVEIVFDAHVDFRGKFALGALCLGMPPLLS
jgi:hypothetical protein